MERNRAESRRRHRDHLTATFAARGRADPAELADAALDALTVWRRTESGEPCMCGCHPRLPDSDLHDFGFDCPCTHSAEQRRQAFDEYRDSQREFWASPEGRRIEAAEEAEEAELAAWLSGRPGVVVTDHGGACPEQWSGEIDGHSFYFRERHGQWRVEIDVPPETGWGEVIAAGSIDDDGYGTTPLERAQFLVGTIRTHLDRRACRLHDGGLAGVAALLGGPVRWCPSCGAKIS